MSYSRAVNTEIIYNSADGYVAADVAIQADGYICAVIAPNASGSIATTGVRICKVSDVRKNLSGYQPYVAGVADVWDLDFTLSPALAPAIGDEFTVSVIFDNPFGNQPKTTKYFYHQVPIAPIPTWAAVANAFIAEINAASGLGVTASLVGVATVRLTETGGAGQFNPKVGSNEYGLTWVNSTPGVTERGGLKDLAERRIELVQGNAQGGLKGNQYDVIDVHYFQDSQATDVFQKSDVSNRVRFFVENPGALPAGDAKSVAIKTLFGL